MTEDAPPPPPRKPRPWQRRGFQSFNPAEYVDTTLPEEDDAAAPGDDPTALARVVDIPRRGKKEKVVDETKANAQNVDSGLSNVIANARLEGRRCGYLGIDRHGHNLVDRDEPTDEEMIPSLPDPILAAYRYGWHEGREQFKRDGV